MVICHSRNAPAGETVLPLWNYCLIQLWILAKIQQNSSRIMTETERIIILAKTSRRKEEVSTDQCMCEFSLLKGPINFALCTDK